MNALKMKKKVAIIGKNNRYTYKIKDLISFHNNLEPVLFEDSKEIYQSREFQNFKAIIFTRDEIESNEVDLISKILPFAEVIPVILVANVVHPQFRSAISLLSGPCCLVIDQFYEPKDIIKTIELAAEGARLRNRDYCRYPVNQSIKLILKNQKAVAADAINLSKGGVGVVCHRSPNIDVGEVLIVHFGDQYRFKAKVAWIKAGLRMGIQFLEPIEKRATAS